MGGRRGQGFCYLSLVSTGASRGPGLDFPVPVLKATAPAGELSAVAPALGIASSSVSFV